MPKSDEERDLLFAELQPLIAGLTRRLASNSEMRQDLYAESYSRFCSLLDHYQPERQIPLKAYLIRQLGSALYSHARSEWRHARRHQQITDHELRRLHHDPTPSWDRKLLLGSIVQELPDAMNSMSERQRLVINLRYIEDRSYEDIAYRLEVKVATVRSLARFGILHLRRVLQRERF